jgi:hypothetical protein
MIGNDYLDWLYRKYGKMVNYNLFKILAGHTFVWQYELDSNCASAGIILRQNYAYEAGVYQSDVADGPCSVLEMLCALCDDICIQSGRDDRDHQMYILLSNLGVIDDYSEESINLKIENWLYRNYTPDGVGNIFYIPNQSNDLRRMDIWSQMTLFVNRCYPLDMNFLNS